MTIKIEPKLPPKELGKFHRLLKWEVQRLYPTLTPNENSIEISMPTEEKIWDLSERVLRSMGFHTVKRQVGNMLTVYISWGKTDQGNI